MIMAPDGGVDGAALACPAGEPARLGPSFLIDVKYPPIERLSHDFPGGFVKSGIRHIPPKI